MADRVVFCLACAWLLAACGGAGGSGLKMCPPPNSTCTSTETATYFNCVVNACDGTYKECYGTNYKSGSFSGPCGAYIACRNACSCNDTTCMYQACGNPDATCIACLAPVMTCSQTCSLPACFVNGSSGDGGSDTGGAGG